MADDLDDFIAKISKDYGEGSVMRMSDSPQDIDVIPSGSIALDAAMGVGGYPRGRVTELFGPESSGKSTLALHAAAEAQKMGENVGYIDAEHALDPIYAAAIGVNVNDLVISQPDDGQQGLNIARAMAKSGKFGLIIVDSVAALTPRSEIEGEIGDASVGTHARMMSQSLRVLTHDLKQTNTAIIFINQLREKIGVMFGSPETTTGGRALKFYASIRLDIRRKEYKKTDGVGSGIESLVKVIKNKVGPPFREAPVQIDYGIGISRPAELIELGAKTGVVTKAGAWFSYQGAQLGQGAAKSAEALAADAKMMEMVEADVRQALGVEG